LNHQGLVLPKLKTPMNSKLIPLPEVVAKALRQQRVRVPEMRLAAGWLWREHRFVFPTLLGTPQEPRNAERARHRLRREIGMDWLSLHGLRHGLGALLVARGVHPRMAMKLLRHSQFSLTMEIYTAVTLELVQEAASEIDAILGTQARPAGDTLATVWL